MEDKFILLKPYTCGYGTLKEGSDIRYFRGQFYVDGGAVPPMFNGILQKLINDPSYTKHVKIEKNEF